MYPDLSMFSFAAQRSLREVVGNSVELSSPGRDGTPHLSTVLWPTELSSGPAS